MQSRTAVYFGAMMVSVIALGTILFADDHTESKLARPTLDDLETRIEKLEARIKQLESQLTGVQQASGVIHQSPPNTLRTPSFVEVPDSSGNVSVPRDWKRGEINGIPYYTVPLSTSKSKE